MVSTELENEIKLQLFKKLLIHDSLESESRWTAASFSSRLPELSAFQLNGRKTSCM